MSDKSSLEYLLEPELSRRNTDLVAGLVFREPRLFDELMSICLRNEEPVSRRAMWVADTVSEKNPELLVPWVKKMIKELPGFTHDGMKRHTLKMLIRSEIPENEKGRLIDMCFNYLVSSEEAVAAKVYAMDILYNISQTEPDLKKELADSIEWRIEEESAGFRSHGKKILKKINKELRDLHY